MHSDKLGKNRLTAAFAVALIFGLPRLAYASAEDVCYLPDGGGLGNCAPLPPACEPAGSVSAQCRTAALQVFFGQNDFVGGRSTIHTDVTHLLAQAVGFPADNAYWIAAYDEATDLGTFTPADMRGLSLTGDWTTATIDGLTRGNFAEGGLLFHFHAPRNQGLNQPSPTIDGLNPDVSDADTEVFLANVRTWALGTSPVPQCTGGLTVPSATGDYATGSECFALAEGIPGSILGALSLVDDLTMNFQLSTGLQLVSADGPVTSDTFDAYVGSAHAADARLGVYLHALVDRISHHQCTDDSALAGPDASGAFTEYMVNDECVQSMHALRHIWETGVDSDQLPEDERTTEAALDAVYGELLAFAQARGTLSRIATSDTYRKDLLERATAALRLEDAAERVTSLAWIACDYGFQPLPGAPSCPAR